MQEMKLASHLMPAARSGVKKITVRKGIKPTMVGAFLHFVNADDPNDVHEVFITGAEVRELRQVPDAVAQEDGFKDLPDLYSGLKQFYPDITYLNNVTIIRFENVVED